MSRDCEDIKVILLGDTCVGKTSIFVRFFESIWNRKYHQNTIGMVYKKVDLEHNSETFSVGVWDTAGSERYAALTNMYYRKSDFAILCFDPSSLQSWERVLFWYNELERNTSDCGICVCATKKDLIDTNELQSVVDHHEVNQFVQRVNGFFIHVSSKTGENISHLFQTIVSRCADDNQRRNYIYLKRQNNLVNNENVQLVNNIIKQSEKTCCG